MGTATTERVAVMAIHPVYANAILAGEKKVEFRKRRLADDIRTVLIYATAPVQRVVGEFSIRETVIAAPETIWDEYGEVGIIDHESFGSYYATSEHAVAFLVDETRRYEVPRALSDVYAKNSIPQSFYYVQRDVLVS